MNRPYRVMLVDDQAMIRAGMRSILDATDGFEIVGECGDARTAIASFEELDPDVVLLDITMPGLSGLDAIAPLRKLRSRVRIVILSHHEGETFVEEALKAGADGYLSKDSEPEELILALRSVMRGDPYLTPKVSKGFVSMARGDIPKGEGSTSRIGSLTPREREVFQLLAVGSSNKEIARELSIALGTVKKHRENLQRKLDCHSAAELARLAIREGLLDS